MADVDENVVSRRKSIMPARSTRQEARARILGTFQAQLDRMIPEDEGVALKGATFADFEDQVEALAREALPVVLTKQHARCRRCGGSFSPSGS